MTVTGEEFEEVAVELLFVGTGQPVRGTRVDLELRAGDDLRRLQGSCLDGYDLVVVAMEDQRRYVDLLEVFGEIGLGEGLDAVVRTLDAHGHRHQPERIARTFRDVRPLPVRAVEGIGEIFVVLRTVGRDASSDLIERLDRQTLGVRLGLEHQRRDGAEQHDLRHSGRSVAAHIPGHLASSCRVSDQYGVMEVESLDDGGEVVGVVVEIIAVPGLTRPASTPAVVGDCAEAAVGDELRRTVPRIGGQRPPLAEDDGLAAAPVLVEDVDPIGGGDKGHSELLTGLNVLQ